MLGQGAEVFPYQGVKVLWRRRDRIVFLESSCVSMNVSVRKAIQVAQSMQDKRRWYLSCRTGLWKALRSFPFWSLLWRWRATRCRRWNVFVIVRDIEVLVRWIRIIKVFGIRCFVLISFWFDLAFSSVIANCFVNKDRIFHRGERPLELVSLSGARLMSTTDSEINVSSLTSGSYFVKIVTDQGTVVRSFVRK